MADAADIANDELQRQLDVILAGRRTAPPYTISASECEECGVAIPAARRQAVPGCSTCVDCQALLEMRR